LAKSSLLPLVEDGLQALAKAHRLRLATDVATAIGDSLDIDEAFKPGHEQDNRWDYLLGHTPSGALVAMEPHSARTGEITTVIKKATAARAELRAHLNEGVRVATWLYVASGKNHFADTEKAVLRLSQSGITFVSGDVQARHLPQTTRGASKEPARAARRAGKGSGRSLGVPR